MSSMTPDNRQTKSRPSEESRRDFLLWSGPVTPQHLSQVVWTPPAPHIYTVNNFEGGIGSSAFSSWAQSLTAPKLDAIFDRASWTPQAGSVVGACGFSAAHGLLGPLCAEPRSLEQLDFLGAFDAWYGTGAGPGYLTAAERAAWGPLTAVFTCSDSQDPHVGSSWKQAHGLISRFAMTRAEPLVSAPCETWRRGGLWVCHVPGDKFEDHRNHATRFAAEVLTRLWPRRPQAAPKAGLLQWLSLGWYGYKIWKAVGR